MLSTFVPSLASVHKLLSLLSSSSNIQQPSVIINIYPHTHCVDARLICLQICFVISATRTCDYFFFIIAFSHLDIKSFIFSSFLKNFPIHTSIFHMFFLFSSKNNAQPFSYLFSSSPHHGSSGLGPRYLFRLFSMTTALIFVVLVHKLSIYFHLHNGSSGLGPRYLFRLFSKTSSLTA